MKRIISTLFLFLVLAYSHAQGVKISESGGDPDESAILHLESDTRGFLPPSMTTAQRDGIPTPAAGLQIFNSDTNCLEYYRGPGGGWYSLCPQPAIVITNPLGSFGPASAVCGGIVANDGGSPVVQRGICWGTSENPTLEDAFTIDGIGVGIFVSTLTGLLPATTYYVRSYAVNAAATSFGNEFSFTTPEIPEVLTGSASDIFATFFTISGEALSDGGSVISARGFCWSLEPSPDLSDAFVIAGTGTGVFSGTPQGLAPFTTYFVRAFASNAMFTGYGAELEVSTNNSLVFNVTGSYTWTVPNDVTEIEVLVVGGGGASGASSGQTGGHYNGGGGGAGGVIHETAFSVTPGTPMSIIVGAGGLGVVLGNGFSGSHSAFGELIAFGGGGGGEYGQDGLPGGSGGGGGRDGGVGGLGTPGQGNDGGSEDSGGGGGAGEPASGIDGGHGVLIAILDPPTYYGGGGGGTGASSIGGNGGLGGGGDGRNSLDYPGDGEDGEPNTGGGGGGAGVGYRSGDGGSGIVIIKIL